MLKDIEIAVALAAVILAAALTSGCGAAYYSAKTIATYRILPDGTLEASYDSSRSSRG